MAFSIQSPFPLDDAHLPASGELARFAHVPLWSGFLAGVFFLTLSDGFLVEW